jgi:hypothetical protein
MTIDEKKQNIITSIKTTTDELLVDEKYNLLHGNYEVKEIEFDDIPEDLQLKLTRAIEDYKQGPYITHSQMKQKIEQWLTK